MGDRVNQEYKVLPQTKFRKKEKTGDTINDQSKGTEK
jgi:hypothetical protein